MATAMAVDHAMAVVVTVGAVEFVVIFNAVVMDTKEEAAEESRLLEERKRSIVAALEAAINGLGAMILYSLFMEELEKKSGCSGSHSSLQSLLWHGGSAYGAWFSCASNKCFHCHTLLWHIFWGALKRANGIEGGSTIVVRVIACFQPLHNCQEKPMTHLGEQVCQSEEIMLERLCAANHSLYAVCMPSICASLSMSMTGRMGTSTAPKPFTVYTILHSYVAIVLRIFSIIRCFKYLINYF
ncbi:hypothetical protein HN873_069589 [Arachis hypogaea]